MRKAFTTTLILLAGFAAGAITQGTLSAQPTPRVYELRTYTAPDGKLEGKVREVPAEIEVPVQ